MRRAPCLCLSHLPLLNSPHPVRRNSRSLVSRLASSRPSRVRRQLRRSQMANPIILGAKDFAPLLQDAGAMKEAVDAVERAMLAEYQGRVRQGSMADETKVADQPSTARFN